MKEKLYEAFHGNTNAQFKLITSSNFTYRIITEVLNKYISNGKSVLDIGCGAGTLCFYLANKDNKCVGVDVSDRAIRFCKQTAKNLDLEKRTAFKVINFPRESLRQKFDVVILTEVIEHLENDNLALKKIYELLNKDGIAIISTPSQNAPLYKMGLAKKFDERVGHLRRYTVEELVRKCEKVGFKVIETKKTEGIIRNFLFLNPIAGKSLRVVKYFVSDLVTFLDNISLKLFGESDIFVIMRKPQ